MKRNKKVLTEINLLRGSDPLSEFIITLFRCWIGAYITLSSTPKESIA